MAYVITESSSVACAHNGAVSLTGTDKLVVSGAKAVLMESFPGATISSACTIVDDPNTSTLKCRTVVAATAGASTKLTVGGKPVALDNVTGTTSGTPPPTGATFSASSAGQQKLKAV